MAALLALQAGTTVPIDTVVVCPDQFRPAMAPWVAHRQGQGHQIAIVSNLGTTEDLRAAIVRAGQGGSVENVLLVGDVVWPSQLTPEIRARSVPVEWAKAEVNVHWGSEPHLSTDNWAADLDDDGVPEVAVGRLTADTPEETAAIVAKILAYERSRDTGPWRRRMHFVAGAGGFGVLADSVVEGSARTLLTQAISPAYEVSMTHGSWRSPFCPDPRRFRQTTIESLNSGCQFWIYMGHGIHVELDQVRTPGGDFPILSVNDIRQLKCQAGHPIALFMSCYAGAFDAQDDCLAEEMLRAPGGPVAVIAGTRVTMPYAMSILSLELARLTMDGPAETLGEAMLNAKLELLREGGEERTHRAMLDAVAQVVSPMPNKLAEERAEHVLLFNLLGDPLLRLRRPKQVELTIPDHVAPGDTVSITGTSEVDGQATVELVVRRDRFATKVSRRWRFPNSPSDWAEFQQVHAQANDRRLATAAVEIRAGHLYTQLTVPDNAQGECRVRVYVEGAGDYAVGAVETVIQPLTVVEKPDGTTTR